MNPRCYYCRAPAVRVWREKSLCANCSPVLATDYARRTDMQRRSNSMLYMRRMMGEIALLLRMEDPNYKLSDEETRRILQVSGWDELLVERASKRLMDFLMQMSHQKVAKQ